MNPIDDAKAEVFRQESWLEGPESVFLAFGGMQGEVLDNVRALVTDHDAEGGVQPEVLGVRATPELLEGKTAIPWFVDVRGCLASPVTRVELPSQC